MGFHTTISGLELDPANPRPEQITITDIAEGLGKECRFAGQCQGHYSVAQHSLMVADLLPPELKLAGLLHDAAEAYTGDVPKPTKDAVPGFRELEDRIMAAVAERFGLPWPLPPAIKEADRVALATEYRDLVPRKGTPWPCIEGVRPLPQRIRPLDHEVATSVFLARYRWLTRGEKEEELAPAGEAGQ